MSNRSNAWILGSLGVVALLVVGVALALVLHPKPAAAPLSVAGHQDVMSLAQRMRSDPGSITEADRKYIHNLPPQQRAQYFALLSGTGRQMPTGNPPQ